MDGEVGDDDNDDGGDDDDDDDEDAWQQSNLCSTCKIFYFNPIDVKSCFRTYTHFGSKCDLKYELPVHYTESVNLWGTYLEEII